MANYNIAEQALGFDRVLTWENQVDALVKDEAGQYWLQIKATDAKTVAFVIQDVPHECKKDENGIWRAKYPLTTGMNYVQLLIDGVEVLTPLLPISYGYSRPYNYVALETGEDFYAITDVPHGSVRKEYFLSKVTGEWESCTVYTPAAYETDVTRQFPVLYLQHGHGENEVGWTASGKVHFILDNLIAAGKAEPMLVVMSNGMVQTVNEAGERIVDFRLFEQQLLDDIMPFVENRFRAGGCKELRAMAGLSMGSLQTSIVGLSHPELFSGLGVFSGFVTDMITGSELDQVDRGAGDQAHLQILSDAEVFHAAIPLFFRAMGTEDPFWEFFEKDDAMLAEKGIDYIRKTYAGTHDWNVWRMCICDFTQLLFKGVK